MNNLTIEKSTQYVGRYIADIDIEGIHFVGYGEGVLNTVNDLLEKINWYFHGK